MLLSSDYNQLKALNHNNIKQFNYQKVISSSLSSPSASLSSSSSFKIDDILNNKGCSNNENTKSLKPTKVNDQNKTVYNEFLSPNKKFNINNNRNFNKIDSTDVFQENSTTSGPIISDFNLSLQQYLMHNKLFNEQILMKTTINDYFLKNFELQQQQQQLQLEQSQQERELQAHTTSQHAINIEANVKIDPIKPSAIKSTADEKSIKIKKKTNKIKKNDKKSPKKIFSNFNGN